MEYDVSADSAYLRKAMMRLNAEHREILVLVCARGMNYGEASDKLGIPIDAVRSRLTRARAELQLVMTTMVTQEGGPRIPEHENMPVVPVYGASKALQKRA